MILVGVSIHLWGKGETAGSWGAVAEQKADPSSGSAMPPNIQPIPKEKSSLLSAAQAGPSADSALHAANPEAVQEVEAGRRAVAYASWWGFDPQDATRALQSALRSKAKKVIIPKMPTAWIVDKIELVGEKEIVFEPGVEVIAKRGAFRGKGDSLFTAWNQSHLKLIGPRATLRMWRADYDQPPYEKAEWRHVLSLRGCSDVLVEGLTLAESGGDGVYLGAGRRGEPNRNITIRNVVCLNNYRQGISVITAENLLLENVVMRGTRGTPPAAGIDFEPNRPQELLTNCVLRNCVFEDNASFGMHVYLGAMNASSRPISIRLENCTSRGTNAGSLSIVNRGGPDEAVRGVVEVVGCRFEDAGQMRIVVQNPVNGLQVRFSGCRLADPSPEPKPVAPIVFRSSSGDEQDVGQVRFEDFQIVDPAGRPPIRFENSAGVCLREIHGQILVQKGQETIRYDLGPEWLERHFPCDPIRQLPLAPLDRLRVVENKRAAGALQQLPPHRLRAEARYLIFAQQNDLVQLEMAYQQVGRYQGKLLRVEIHSPEGRQVQSVELPFQKTTSVEFRAPETGVFQIVGLPGLNTLRLVRSSHPAAIGGQRGFIHLLGTVGQYYLYLPANRRLGVSVAGEGPKEQFSVELTDQEGRLLWQQANCDSPRSILLEAQEKDRILQLRLLRPKEATLEDVYIQFRGLGALLSFQPEFLLYADPPSPAKK